MVKAGCYLGHMKCNSHPKARRIVATRVNGVDIIDLDKTLDYMIKAQKFVTDTVAKGQTILFVGTKRQSMNLLQKSAEEVGMPYASRRWLGGTLTNFSTIRKRVNYYERLKARFSTGAFDTKYTKKEKLDFENEIKDLKIRVGGLSKLRKPPAAIIIVDPKIEEVAFKEAILLKIPIIATSDTNIDITKIDYPVPMNDDVEGSIEIFLKSMTDAVKEGLKRKGQQKVNMKKTEVSR